MLFRARQRPRSRIPQLDTGNLRRGEAQPPDAGQRCRPVSFDGRTDERDDVRVTLDAIFRDHAMESKLKGAPINWVPMEAVPTNAGATSIIYQAPHPHGAVLMADYILSPEGQKILADLQFGNPSMDFGFKRWYPEAGLNTEQYDTEATKWQKILREIGRKG